MPELPEVEITARGLSPLIGSSFETITIRNHQLRLPIAADLPARVAGQTLLACGRRAKYLILTLQRGWLVWHLGMSGSIRIDDPKIPLRTHDQVVITTSCQYQLRYHDPRRFGSLSYCDHPPQMLPGLAKLGVEPLTDNLTAQLLFTASRNRNISIKQLIMDSSIVVGIGNIYANEALFSAGIDPRLNARRLTHAQAQRLTDQIKHTLQQAIAAGGTTLRDFINSQSNPGYFQQSLMVYGREGKACKRCDTRLQHQRIGQRATVWCPHCQKKRPAG